MSLTHDDQAICPCGATVEVYVADSLNPARHAHLRELLLGRKLHVYTCNVCKQPFVVEKELLYLDWERRQLLAVFPRDERAFARERARSLMASYERYMCQNAPTFVRAEAERFLVRICFGYEELREKIVTDDAGLSDLVVEALKMDVMNTEAWFREWAVLTLRLDRLDEDGTLVFHPEWLDETRPTDGTERRTVRVKRELYDSMDGRHDDLLRLRPGLASGPHVSLLRLLDWEAPPPEAQRRPLV